MHFETIRTCVADKGTPQRVKSVGAGDCRKKPDDTDTTDAHQVLGLSPEALFWQTSKEDERWENTKTIYATKAGFTRY